MRVEILTERCDLRIVLLTALLVGSVWSPRVGATVVTDTDLEARVRELSLEDKLAQMFVAGVPASGDIEVRAGGIIFLGGQLRDVQAVPGRVAELQERAEIPLLVVADVEGGQVNRLSRHPELADMPSAAAMSQAGVAEAQNWGRRVGRTMLGLGLNCNLAPVLDLAAEGHMHRQERSFGDDPAHAAKIAGAFAQGLSLEGVMAFGKHYPGYGSSSEDSDHAYVIDDRSSQEFTRQESAFALMGEGISGVMMTNIGYRAYGEVPAAFSPELVAMAHERGWLTITDDLAIPALAELAGGDPLEVVRRAFLAGNDLLLTTWPLSAEGAPDYVGVLAALVRDQPELQARVDQSVLRILRVKSELGLLP